MFTSTPYFEALVGAISRRIDPETARGLEAAFALSDRGEIATLLEGAGLEEVSVAELALEIGLPPMREFVPEHIAATPMSAGYRRASERDRERVLADLEEAMAGFSTEAGVRVLFTTYVAAGYRRR